MTTLDRIAVGRDSNDVRWVTGLLDYAAWRGTQRLWKGVVLIDSESGARPFEARHALNFLRPEQQAPSPDQIAEAASRSMFQLLWGPRSDADIERAVAAAGRMEWTDGALHDRP